MIFSTASIASLGGWNASTPRATVGHAEPLEQQRLARLGTLEREGFRPVDQRHAMLPEVGQQVAGVGDGPAMAAQVSRGAHTIEDQRVRAGRAGRVESMGGGSDPLVGQSAPLDLAEERAKPLGVLVKNADGGGHVASEPGLNNKTR